MRNGVLNYIKFMLYIVNNVVALHIAFQSLYTDNVNIPVDNIIGVLAAASLIGLVCITVILFTGFINKKF